MTKPIGVIRAEGIGPEIMDVALRCLNAIGRLSGIQFSFIEYQGKASAEEYSDDAYRELHGFYKTIQDQGGCILRAAIYARIVFQLRRDFGLICKPIYFPFIQELASDTLLRQNRALRCDIVLVRENTKEFVFDDKESFQDDRETIKVTYEYRRADIEALASYTFQLARSRRKILHLLVKGDSQTSVTNLLLRVFQNASKQYPEVQFDWDHPDTGFAALLKNPDQFDVIVTQNKEGDLITDPLGTLLYGSHAIVPSANINPLDGFMVFQTVHGTSHALAGQNKANPIGMVRSTAMMLSLFFKLEKEADIIETAVRRVLGKGYRTVDMYRPDLGHTLVGTKEMGELIVAEVSSNTKDCL